MSEIQNDYDAVPYQSYPYPNSHPVSMHAIAKFFGVDAPDFRKSKVLELGSASGGNIIPIASMYPDCQVTGIDLSKVQVDIGNQQIKELGLKNIKLEHKSIMDITPKFGKFDYIIVHGILSWVPQDVQDKIFEICDQNLEKNGIAYISYNTFPGWNMVKSLRDMMLYHTKNFKTPQEKANQAMLLLKFVKDNNGDNTALAQIIQNEIDTVSKTNVSYLMHDHLEENNIPLYFHDFMERANKNNLQYLGETSLSSMFAGNFSKETFEVLMQSADDIVRVEQYMDFIRNRRFRMTLLCHNGVKINRNIKPEIIKDFYITTNLVTSDDLSDIKKDSPKSVKFINNTGAEIATEDYCVQKIFKELFDNKNKPMLFKDILKKIQKDFTNKDNWQQIETVTLNNILRLVLAGAVFIHSTDGDFVNEPTSKPKAYDLAIYQAAKNNWATSTLSEKIDMDIFTRVLMQYLNGKNTHDDLVKRMVKHVEKGDIKIQNGDQVVSENAEVEKYVKNFIDRTLEIMARRALLVS